MRTVEQLIAEYKIISKTATDEELIAWYNALEPEEQGILQEAVVSILHAVQEIMEAFAALAADAMERISNAFSGVLPPPTSADPEETDGGE